MGVVLVVLLEPDVDTDGVLVDVLVNVLVLVLVLMEVAVLAPVLVFIEVRELWRC